MSVTLAFDVYGTLINTHGLIHILEKFAGKEARNISYTWRNKQLEYSFRRGLMQNYVDFSVCTRQALDFACQAHHVSLNVDQKRALLEGYKSLPRFDEVEVALRELRSNGFRIYAFSNGSGEAVDDLLCSAGIRDLFLGVVSCDDMKSFKPNPGVYSHFLREADTRGHQTWLISSNPFDVTGAISAGLQAVWVKRTEEALFDPWEIRPTAIINSLSELENLLQSQAILSDSSVVTQSISS